MTWVVLTVLLIVFGCIGLAVGIAATDSDTKLIAFACTGLCVIVWLVMSPFFMFHTVGQRQVGIVTNFSGTISGSASPGVVTVAPWQHVKRENVGLLREDFDLSNGNSAVSKDQQSIFARITLNYQVDPQKIVDLYKRVGPSWRTTLLDSRVLQDFKEVTSLYTAAEITTKREQLRRDTKERLVQELAPYDIKVVDFFVKNIGYTQAYEDAITAKNKQVQQALQAEAKVAQSQAEAQQAVATAEGKARATIVQAKADATANRLRRLSLTPLLVQWEAYQVLNPNVQVIYTPAGTSLFVPQVGK